MKAWADEVFSTYTVIDVFVDKRAALNSDMKNYIADKFEMYGIVIDTVNFTRIETDEETAAVNAQQELELSRIEAEKEKEVALIRAQQDKEQSEIKAEQDEIKAQGESNALRVKAEAEAETNKKIA